MISDLKPNDFGPIYLETNMNVFPVEPWNTFSNIIFLWIMLFFVTKMRKDRIFPAIFMVVLPILLTGFIGGTIYHATRSASIWLYLDFIPIMTLCLLASTYFWMIILKSKLRGLLLALGPFIIFRFVRTAFDLPIGIMITAGYSFMATLIILPALLVSRKNSWSGLNLLCLAIISFIIAIYFRYADSANLLPMGTHFLWHIFGGLSAFFMMQFLYAFEKQRIQTTQTI